MYEDDWIRVSVQEYSSGNWAPAYEIKDLSTTATSRNFIQPNSGGLQTRFHRANTGFQTGLGNFNYFRSEINNGSNPAANVKIFDGYNCSFSCMLMGADQHIDNRLYEFTLYPIADNYYRYKGVAIGPGIGRI